MARKAVFHDTGVFDDGDGTITLGGVTQDDLDAVAAAAQPVDSDLTAIAALTTTAFGRGLLALADAAAGRTAIGLGTAATAATGDFDAAGASAAAQAASQPVDSDLTAIAALTTTSYGRAFLALADAAAGRTALGLGTLATQSGTFSGTSSGTNTGDQSLAGLQPIDADLTTIAALDSATAGALVTDGAGWIRKTYAQLKTALSLVKADVGLGNVDNTADTAKPVSTAQQTALDAKADKNAAITGATKTKITYDTKGLVTAGADATTADFADSANKRYVTDAQLTVLGNTSGANTGDQSLTGLVPKTLYDANTIIKADTDDTPVALTMGASTILARLAAGNIVAATPAELRTLLALVIGTNVQAWDADLDSIAALTTTAFGRSLLTPADAAAARVLIGTDDLSVIGGATNFVLASADTSAAALTLRNLSGFVWTMVANATYVVDLWLLFAPAAATTGLGATFDTSVAVTFAGVTFTHQLATGGTLTGGDSIADAATSGLSSGTPRTTNTLVEGKGLVKVGGTGGTCQLMWQPEVAAVAVIAAGSVMRVRRVA